MTLSSASGNNWNTVWNGGNDVLTVTVANITAPISWSLKRYFPTDPSSTDTQISSGQITQDGAYNITLSYPAKGAWGPANPDGSGTHESHATLTIGSPCSTVAWDRWYADPLSADLSVQMSHTPQPFSGKDLTFTITVTNIGPYEASGVTASFSADSCVKINSMTPSKGTCNTSTGTCSLGSMKNATTATITVETQPNGSKCALAGTATVSASSPSDPVSSNNSVTDTPTR
jgi:hypothetical protein